MKLRHQILILLGVPIVCQLFTVAVLFQAVAKVDESAQQEARAKEVIALAQECNGILGRAVMGISAHALVGGKQGGGREQLLSVLKLRIARLEELTKNNPKAETLVKRLKEAGQRFLTYWDELIGTYGAGDDRLFLAQFFFKGEFIQSLEVLFTQLCTDNDKLSELYRPMVGDLAPEAIRARTGLRQATVAVVAANILLVAALAMAVNQQTLTRLQILLENIRAFSRREKSLRKLKGQDELAELDNAFHEMSDEWHRLDEVQKSLRAMVSHDLRSPLTSINLALELLIDTKIDTFDEKTAKTIRRVSSETQRLARLAKTLLDIEKLESGQIQVDVTVLPCRQIVAASVDAVASLADRKSLTIELAAADREINLKCDEDRTVQSLVNLLSNAIKFAPTKTIISVNYGLATNGNARIEVVDCGPGVKDEQVQQLFSKFVQLDQPEAVKKEGSGLGLYICRLLIEAQGGSIGYSRAGDLGSCFWIELPAVAASPHETN